MNAHTRPGHFSNQFQFSIIMRQRKQMKGFIKDLKNRNLINLKDKNGILCIEMYVLQKT